MKNKHIIRSISLIACSLMLISCGTSGSNENTPNTASSIVSNDTSSTTNLSNSNSSKKSTTYTVSFNSEGGTEVDDEIVNSGESFSDFTTPTKTGCLFSGWYTSWDYTTEFDINTKITSDITLYAKWITDPSSNHFPFDFALASKEDKMAVQLDIYNKTNFDIYYFENLCVTISDTNTSHICADGVVKKLTPDAPFKKGTSCRAVIEYGPEYCDASYYTSHKKSVFTAKMSFRAIVLPLELSE